jgi:hypothetical protein
MMESHYINKFFIISFTHSAKIKREKRLEHGKELYNSFLEGLPPVQAEDRCVSVSSASLGSCLSPFMCELLAAPSLSLDRFMKAQCNP